MIKRSLVVLLMLWLSIMTGTSFADTLWYNGDFNTAIPSLIKNDYQSSTNYGMVYDDFIVSEGGWTIDSVWSNNRIYGTEVPNVTIANWEIRSGVSAGNGGTLVASGSGTPTLNFLGYSGTYTHYQVLFSGLSVPLTPGTYWLGVAPVLSNSETYIVATSGANAVGEPQGNNRNSFWDSNYGYFSASEFGDPLGDYSMGVAGASTVPLPASLPLLGSGLLGLAGCRRFRRKS
jgi:hypothetical protein